MATRGAIYISNLKLGFFKMYDSDIFLNRLCKMIKDTNSNIFEKNLNHIITDFIAWDSVEMIENRYNNNPENILDYINHAKKTDIEIEPKINSRNFNTFDIEYFYKFMDKEIRAYTIDVFDNEVTYLGKLSYDDINNKELKELECMIKNIIPL